MEVLLMLLLVSLLAAALMSGIMDKREQLESVAAGEVEPGTQDLAGILALWTSDPESLEGVDLKGVELRGEAEKREYEALVHQLDESGRLGDWKSVLRERLRPDHPMLVALEAAEGESGDVRRAKGEVGPDAANRALEDDPDVRWIR